jgi:hypothetical protein
VLGYPTLKVEMNMVNEKQAHIMAKLHLFSAEHGGRREPTSSNELRALVGAFGRYHPICFDLTQVGSLVPGAFTFMPIPAHFEVPHLILPFLKVGSYFMVRERRVIGETVVVKILLHIQPKDAYPQNDAQPAVVTLSAGGWVSCPCCGRRFKLSDSKRWNSERHMTCGQKLIINIA